MEGSYKAAKGLIKIKANVQSGCLSEVQISGDFFMYPEDRLWVLEHALKGTVASREKIMAKIKAFYEYEKVLTPGVVPEDFAEAILKTIVDAIIP
ncbi:MAG: lipoate protein ligase C-terminal domain-containing protein [Candidatus Bathyarchaeota archaeon]